MSRHNTAHSRTHGNAAPKLSTRVRATSETFRSPTSAFALSVISGDARPSTAALGKKIFDMKVDFAVKQIQGFQKMGKAG